MNIQLKHSSVLDGGRAKAPTPPYMSDGEVAVNFNAIDPCLFIKDSSGIIRKLSFTDAADTQNVQSDWAETDPSSYAYIKNKQIVEDQIDAINIELDTKIGHAPIDGKPYVSKDGGWYELEVQEAPEDGTPYVRQDGDWVSLDLSLYVTLDVFNTKVLELETELATKIGDAPDDGLPYVRYFGVWSKLDESLDIDLSGYVDFDTYNQDIADLLALINTKLDEAPDDGQVYGRNGLTESWQLLSIDSGIGEAPTDGQVYGRNGLTESWQLLNNDSGIGEAPADGGLYVRNGLTQSWSNFPDQSGDFVTLDSPPQSISTMKTFLGGLTMSGASVLSSSLTLSGGNYDFGSTVAIRQQSPGFTITEGGKTGTGGNSNSAGQGGICVKFLGGTARNASVGIRNNSPSAALHVSSAMRANQYLDGAGNATFNGRLFRSADGYDFTDTLRLHGAVIQSQPSVRTIDAANASYASAITAAERSAATSIRSALKAHTINGKRRFTVDQTSLSSAFSDQGLDIADYDIMQQVTLPGHEEYSDEYVTIAGLTESTVMTINYETLFAFLLAAGPDLSSLEARIAALEA